jgi:hypothetical protein
VNELRTELETELRAVDVAPAPVGEAMRAGRRIRRRRRFAVAASVVAVLAIAAGVPVLTGTGAAPAPPAPPVIRHHGDPVVTETPPGRGAPAGEIAQGTIGARTWRVVTGQLLDEPSSDHCVAITGTAVSAVSMALSCGGPERPATAPAMLDSQGPGSGGIEATVGPVGTDVVYLVLTFTDGQRLKLVPVTVDGRRLVAFVAPLSMTIASVTAHLGTAGHDNGQTETAIPFSLPGQLPLFVLWQRPGQAAVPRASRVIASGVADGRAWSLTAYVGPWGTCFVPDPPGTTECEESLPSAATTNILGSWDGSAPGWQVVYGSAAPGVASVAVTLSNGKTVTLKPVAVGNERLFTFLARAGVATVRWTAYSASGAVVGQSFPPSGTLGNPLSTPTTGPLR